MTLHELVILLSALVGSQALVSVISWVRDAQSRKSHAVQRAEWDKLQTDFTSHRNRLNEVDERIGELKLIVLRQILFRKPLSKGMHEDALAMGEEYIALGGNGLGHVRLEWLKDQYQLRLAANDWDYQHDMEDKKHD